MTEYPVAKLPTYQHEDSFHLEGLLLRMLLAY